MRRWRGRRARTKASIGAIGAVAAFAAALSLPTTGAAGVGVSVGPTGYCTPAYGDPLSIPNGVGAGGIPPTPTRPIAILDTGVAPVDQLAGRVLPGYDAVSGGRRDGDDDGHGTLAAGLAASAGPGAVGVSPGSPVLPIRIYPDGHVTSADALVRGITLAVEQQAGVIAIDGSAPIGDATPAELVAARQAIDDAVTHGVLVVAPAGDGNPRDAPQAEYPGSLPHVLTVGSLAPSGDPSLTSLTGPWLDSMVPAEGVLGPLPSWCDFGWGSSSGTSLASPVLAAATALVRAHRPDVTTEQLFELMRHAADDLRERGRDNATGFGRLDVATAISAVPEPKETQAEVDDDPYWLRGRYARLHRTMLRAHRLHFAADGSVSSAKDPSDVYRIRLFRRESVTINVKAADPASVLELSILSPQAGDFDVSNGADRNRIRATGGLLNAPTLHYTATHAGTYYVAVETSDAIDPNDPTATPLDEEPYVMHAVAHRPHHKHHRRRHGHHKRK